MCMQRELRFARDEIGPVHCRFEFENEVEVSLTKILYDHFKNFCLPIGFPYMHVEEASHTLVILSLRFARKKYSCEVF